MMNTHDDDCYRMNAEPHVLKRGKAFHKHVQKEWNDTINDGEPHNEKSIEKLSGRGGRIDVFVDGMDELYSVVEIKSTNWDRIKPENISRNVRRHIRQIFDYVDAVMHKKDVGVSPGVVYPSLPSDQAVLDKIEAMFNEEGIQVVWQNESMEALRIRAAQKEASK